MEPTLPFVLLDRDAPDPPAPTAQLVDRIDSLHGLVEETRAEMAALRSLNERLLEIVEEAWAASDSISLLPGPGPAAEETAIAVRLLGAFEVRAGGAIVEGWRSRKARQLFAFLALDPGKPVPRETLIETFWPESDPARGANNLSIAVHHVRSRLGEALPEALMGEHRGLLVQQGLYRLDPALHWRVDAVEFRELVERARATSRRGDADGARRTLGEALAAYGGEFLESDPTEEWTIEPRGSLAQLFTWALRELVEDGMTLGDWQRVAAHAEVLVERDPGDEAAYRSAIRAHATLGNRGEAMRQFLACERWLRAELGMAPSAETIALLRELHLLPDRLQ